MANPIAELEALKASDKAEIESQRTALTAEQAAYDQKASAFTADNQEMLRQHAEENKGANAEYLTAARDEADFARNNRPAPFTPPEYKPRPVVNAQEYQQLATGLVAMAMIGGALGKGDWLGVGRTLNGAMAGYLQGNEDEAKRHLEDFQRQYDAAKDKAKTALDEYQAVLESRHLSTNEKLAQLRVLSSQHQDDAVLMAAREKSLDKAAEHVRSMQTALTQSENHYRTALIQIDEAQARRDAAAAARAAADGTGLDDDTITRVAEATLAGDKSAPGAAVRGRGRTAAADMDKIQARISKLAKERGISGAQLAGIQRDFDAQKQALRNMESRRAAVEFGSKQLDKVASQIETLVAKLNGQSPEFVNRTINQLRKSNLNPDQLRDLSELHTLTTAYGREYYRIVSAATSNAQLAVSAQQKADQLANADLPLSALQGVFKGVREDANAFAEAAREGLGEFNPGAASGAPAPAPAGVPAGWSVKVHP